MKLETERRGERILGGDQEEPIFGGGQNLGPTRQGRAGGSGEPGGIFEKANSARKGSPADLWNPGTRQGGFWWWDRPGHRTVGTHLERFGNR